MLINKKLLALALLPLFAACVVDDGDDDDTLATVTDPTATGTDPTATATGTDPTATGTDPTATSTDPTADTTAGETETGGDAGFCAPGCAEAIDCCSPQDPNCEAGLGTFPYAWTCEAGACVNPGCSADSECEAQLPGQVCADFGGFGLCLPGCAEDVDCQTPGLETWVCTGGGGTYCEAPDCTADADCFAPATCNTDTGVCESPPCEADADCFAGVCDAATGFCGCAEAADCGEGLTCVL